MELKHIIIVVVVMMVGITERIRFEIDKVMFISQS